MDAAVAAGMTIPMWMLLGFAAWTVLLLSGTVGVYRWTQILCGRASVSSFRADQVEGEDWYRRSMRAHANCIENLPVFGAIVLALYVGGVEGPAINVLSIFVLISRVLQSLVHVSHVQTDAFVAVRFSMLCVQLISFVALIVLLVRHAVQQ
jgi:uncharacterized MAPEG superfamily protein